MRDIALVCGFALYQAWKFLALFVGVQYSAGAVAGGLFPLVRYSSLATLAVALIALLVLVNKRGNCCQDNRRFCAALVVSGLMMTLCVLPPVLGGAGSFGWALFSGVASGLGTAMADVLWVVKLRRCPLGRFSVFALCSVAVILLLSLGLHLLPDVAETVLLLVAPAGAGLILAFGNVAGGEPEGDYRLLSGLGVTWFVFGASIGMLCALSQTTADRDLATSPWLLAISVAMLLLFLFSNRQQLAVAIAERDTKVAVPLLLLPILVLVVMVVLVVWTPSPGIAGVRVSVSFTLWEMFMLFLVFSMSQNFRLSATRLYLIANIGRTLGVLLGTGVAVAMGQLFAGFPVGADSLAMSAVVVACQAVLMLAYTVTQKGLEKNAAPTASFPLDEAADLVAQRYLLTARETEILKLLAKGRTSLRIHEELCVAHSTVTTHMNHIYKKCNVHSKQQLLDLMEEELRVR